MVCPLLMNSSKTIGKSFLCLAVVIALFLTRLSRAQIAPGAPYPPSPVIRKITWEPRETIIRKEHDSDNWPITWADDDALYTAYGDGSGFEPFVPEKLSLGLAKVFGTPPDFKGENLRAPSIEQRGGGKSGRKAS